MKKKRSKEDVKEILTEKRRKGPRGVSTNDLIMQRKYV